jgi:hypothetical protein
MGRPRKTQDYLVHRLADLLRYGQGRLLSQFSKGDVWEITVADKRVLIADARDLFWAIEKLLCELKPEHRPQVLRQLANVLEGKYSRCSERGRGVFERLSCYD